MRDVADILATLAERRKHLRVPFERMTAVRDVYNSDIAVPLPELGKSDQVAIANMANVGIDQYGMRIASVVANIWFPPLRPGIKLSEDAARDRRLVSYGWWETNRYQIKQRRRSRRYVAYGSAPVLISWDAKSKMPRWDLQDPLGTFPAPSTDPDEVHPEDCIFVFKQPARWLQRNYPTQYRMLRRGPNETPDHMFELVRYVDCDQETLIVVGSDTAAGFNFTGDGNLAYVVLENVPNRAGVCPAICPGRITLDRPMGQFETMIGQYMQEAEFNALAVIAARKAIFPDIWLVDGLNQQAKIVKVANGLTGEVGRISGGSMQVITPQPGYQTNPTQDRMREDQRLSAGIPSDMTGQAPSSIRTGRRGSQLFSAVVDFPVQEAQEMFALAAQEELKVAIALDKTYGGSQPRAAFISWKGAKGRVDYTPDKLWEDDAPVTVSYPFAGTDVDGLTIELGQLKGMDAISIQTLRENHPAIQDAEFERDRVEAEKLDEAFYTAMATWASNPATDPLQIARVRQLIASDKMEPYDALAKVRDESQQAQAQQVTPGAPEAQPGLMANAQPQAPIPDVPPGVDHLSMLLQSLRGPQHQNPNERQPVTPGAVPAGA